MSKKHRDDKDYDYRSITSCRITKEVNLTQTGRVKKVPRGSAVQSYTGRVSQPGERKENDYMKPEMAMPGAFKELKFRTAATRPGQQQWPEIRLEREQCPDHEQPWKPYLSFILKSVATREVI